MTTSADAALKRTRVILILLCLAALGWMVYALTAEPYRIRAGSAPYPPPPDVSKRYVPKALNEYAAPLRQREMFRQSLLYETRRTEVVNVLGSFQFLGVSGKGPAAKAFIYNKESGQSALYGVGELLGDLTVEAVRDDRVVFSHQGERLELVP
ncbi:MAG: hypothetical protein RLY93_02905 [Sumerlaeia bacterium]